jgi:hypothetical protein
VLMAAISLKVFCVHAEEPALVGRWVGRNAFKRGDYEGYNCYVFTPRGNCAISLKAFNTKTKKWYPAEEIFKKEMKSQWLRSLVGSYQVAPPKFLLLKVAVLFSELPVDMEFKIQGETLTLRAGRDSPPLLATVCKKVDRFSFEPDEPWDPEHKSLLDQLDETVGLERHRFHFDPKSGQWTEHPLDHAMIKNFQVHHNEFETLLDMIKNDHARGLLRVGENWTRPEDPASIGISEERLGQYRSLFGGLGLESGVGNYWDDQRIVEFMASSVGLLNRGSTKGYCWLASPPQANDSNVVEDLDAYVAKKHEHWRKSFEITGRALSDHFIVYRPLDGNWYLYYEH